MVLGCDQPRIALSFSPCQNTLPSVGAFCVGAFCDGAVPSCGWLHLMVICGGGNGGGDGGGWGKHCVWLPLVLVLPCGLSQKEGEFVVGQFGSPLCLLVYVLDCCLLESLVPQKFRD